MRESNHATVPGGKSSYSSNSPQRHKYSEMMGTHHPVGARGIVARKFWAGIHVAPWMRARDGLRSHGAFVFLSSKLHEHAHKGMSGSSELFRFPIEGVEWTYRVLSKAPPAHTRPLCRLPPTELPTTRRAARCPRHTFFRVLFSFFPPHGPPGFGRPDSDSLSASIAALLAIYLFRDRAFPPLGARLS